MDIRIRQATETDYPAVSALIEKAFASESLSDHREQFLVERLRYADAFIPELSLVAEAKGQLVGHILLTKLKIKNERSTFDSLALAPVSVLPAFQGQGIGGQLIRKAHETAKALGHTSIILLGHANYYPKFGYHPAYTYGIELPFDVPKENCMAIALVEGGLDGVTGKVEYPKEFMM